MRQAIGTFKERISPVADAEIPEFYTKFYIRFSPKFILDEARRNIQTAEEAALIQAAKKPEQKAAAKNIKAGKPISVGEIIAWLNDHGEQDQLHDTFGISDDYMSISDAGIVSLLIKMDYLSSCDTNKQYIQQLWEKSLLDPMSVDLVDLEKQWELEELQISRAARAPAQNAIPQRGFNHNPNAFMPPPGLVVIMIDNRPYLVPVEQVGALLRQEEDRRRRILMQQPLFMQRW